MNALLIDVVRQWMIPINIDVVISQWDGYSVMWWHKDFVKRGEVILKFLKKTLFTKQDIKDIIA